MAEPLSGGCACGRVRYRAEPTADVGYCSCATCRRASGSGAMVWVVALSATLEVTGELATWRSSGHAVRRFCPHCGSQLFLLEDAEPHLVEIAAGTLDQPDAVTPVTAIWTAGRPLWAAPPRAVAEHLRDPGP